MRLVGGFCIKSGVKQGYVLSSYELFDGLRPKEHTQGSGRTWGQQGK